MVWLLDMFMFNSFIEKKHGKNRQLLEKKFYLPPNLQKNAIFCIYQLWETQYFPWKALESPFQFFTQSSQLLKLSIHEKKRGTEGVPGTQICDRRSTFEFGHN